MLDKLRTALVLVIIGATSGFLIWGANELTAETIYTNTVTKELNYYKELFGKDESFELQEELDRNLLDGILVEEVIVEAKDGTILGYVYKGSDTNSYGDIDVLVGINLDGTINKVVISKTGNTPGYVKSVEKNDLMKFDGLDTDNLDYDTSSGATYTFGSVMEIVETASEYFNANRGDE